MGPTKETISILLASQRTMNCELYEQAFNRAEGLRVVARADNVDDAVQAARANEISVALISSALKDGDLSGFKALQLIQEIRPSIRCVILLEPDEDHLVAAAFRAGAKGVFSPINDGFERLCRCVKQVNAGQVWANSAQLQQVMEAFSRRAPVPVVNAGGERLLTKREEEIVSLVEDGLTNRQIAKALGLSEHTVRNNLFRIFNKLGVSTRVELALYAVNHSDVSPQGNRAARRGKKRHLMAG